MNRWRLVCIVLLGSGLIVPVAAALPPLAQPVPANTSVSAASAKSHVCFAAVFSGPLPGKSDYCLGMRDWNHGHYQSALEFLKLAAGWGNKNAQYTLGLIYYGGHHVPADVALGLAWLQLADERRNDDTIGRAKRSAFHWATPDQRTHAEQLYQTMAATYGDEVAANRAWNRLHNWQRRHGSESGCVRLAGVQAAAARRLGLAGVPPRSIENLLVSYAPISIPQMGAPAGGKSGDGGMKAYREARKRQRSFAMNRAGVCVTLHTQQQVTQQLAGEYFAGWMGTVSVGPLQQVPAPASSSTH